MKAYVISEVDIHDPREYASYALAAAKVIDQYGGKVLARGGRTLTFDGAPPAQRIILVEFESIKAARAFRHSSEYSELMRARDASSSARMFAVESERQ